MDWITEKIAIGNFRDAEEVTELQVNAILCLRDEGKCTDRDDIDVFCVPLLDGAGNRYEAIAEALDSVAGIVEVGEKILVHCRAGQSRSASIVVLYLMKKHGYSQGEAMSLIKSKREMVKLSAGIEEIFSM